MLKSILCDCSDVYILVNETITVTQAGANNAAKRLNEKNKGVILKNCAPFTDCIREINNTLVDNAKYLYVVLQMYDSVEYNDNCSNKLGSLWIYHRADPNDILVNSESFKSKMTIKKKPCCW